MTEDQLCEITASFSRKVPVRLSISFKQDKSDAQSGHELFLTKYQIGKINKGKEITLSVRQLENIIKNGGNLLGDILTGVTSAIPIVKDTAKGFRDKKANDELIAEKRRRKVCQLTKNILFI